MAEVLKEGKRVRIVLEGVTEYDYDIYERDGGGKVYDCGSVILDDKQAVYFENLPVSAVEVTPDPLKPGLYYYPGVGKGQMSGVYKLDPENGKWFDHTLKETEMPDFILDALVPLAEGTR